MSDKLYICPKCLATAHHKGKCDICKTLLLHEDVYFYRKEVGLLPICESEKEKR